MSDSQTIPEVPEDSRALRIVVFTMAVLCVVASCFFVRTAWWMTVLYLGLICGGSFLSYKFRHNEPRWLKYTWWIGILLVGAYAMYEFTGPLRDEFDFVSPFVHFLCGIFAFVTFSMKTRSDLNTASGLGLILLCLSAPVAKGLPYGVCVLGYLSLGAVMMYYDCVSRTLTSWMSTRIAAAPEIPLFKQKNRRRIPRGNTILLLTVVPLLALAMFIYVPRADEFLDKVWAYTKTMKIEYLTDLFYKAALPDVKEDASKEHTGRQWFERNNAKQLPMTGRYSPMKPKTKEEKAAEEAKKDKDKDKDKEKKKAEEEKPNAKKDEKKDTKDKKKTDDKSKSKNSLVTPNIATDQKDKSAKDKQPPPPPKKDLKLTKSDDKKANKTEADLPTPDITPDVKKGEKKEDDKKVDQNEKGAKTKDKSKKTKADSKSDKTKDKPGDTPGSDTKNGAKDKGGKDKAGTDGGGEGKDSADPKTKKGHGKDGKKGGGEGEKGTDGHGGNKDGEGKKGGGKNGDTPAGDATIGGDGVLMLADKLKQDERLVFTVKSRRLVYLRRQCYDFYTGTTWKRSIPKKKDPKPERVRVVDGSIKKEPKKIVPQKVAPVKATPTFDPSQQGKPTAYGNSTDSGIVRGSQPSVFGNTNVDAQPDKSKTAVVEEPKTLRVENRQAIELQDAGPAKSSKVARPFVFETTDRPIFRVGMADALQPVETLPTVELVQEIKVKAKSIGNVIPGGWIPQELKLQEPQKKVDVDALGVMTCPKPILKDAEIKVKTELPIYPIDAMRQDTPLSAVEEDELRTRYAKCLQLPNSMPDAMFKVAEDHSDPRYNWFVQSQQICDYLRENFEYDPVRTVDPKSKDLVQDFLFVRGIGNSNDFASAFVILTRCVGIPSRLVNGFAPGDHNAVTGEQEVRMKHSLVWAEAYIPKFGWVPFDAHPDGVLPAQQRENRYTQKEVEKHLGLNKPGLMLKWTDVITFGIAALISLIVGFIAFKVLVMLYRKWRESQSGRGPEWRLYKRVAKAVKKSMKMTRAPSETPTEFLERVQSVIDERKTAGKVAPEALPAALRTFLMTYSAVYFGRQKAELEHLKYHAEQVVKLTKSVKMNDITVAATGAKSAVRRKEKYTEEDTAGSSAVRRKK